jgi:hypothetical protein
VNALLTVATSGHYMTDLLYEIWQRTGHPIPSLDELDPAEARRVLAPSGVIAVWCYGLLEIDESIDKLVRRFYEEDLGPYWAPERRLVDERYRTIDFPFDEFELPPLAIEQELTLAQLGAYLQTWSATQRFVQIRGGDPVAALIDEIAPVWGAASTPRRTRWPLSLRAGKKAH